MFVQKQASEKYGDGGVERTEHDSLVEAAGLAGANEKQSAKRIHATRNHSPADARCSDVAKSALHEYNRARGHEPADAGEQGDPHRWSIACLANTEIKSSEPEAGQHGESYAFGTTAILGAGDEPEADGGEEVPRDASGSGPAFREHGEKSWYRGAQDSGYRRGQAHSSGRKRTIEDGQRSATGDAARQYPDHAAGRRQRSLSARGQNEHHEQAADIHDRSEQESVGAAGGVSA